MEKSKAKKFITLSLTSPDKFKSERYVLDESCSEMSNQNHLDIFIKFVEATLKSVIEIINETALKPDINNKKIYKEINS